MKLTSSISLNKFSLNNKSKKNEKEKKEKRELPDNIKLIREKNKEFQATNDHEFYLIVAFSNKQDKDLFISNLDLDENIHTFVDGYELASKLNLKPNKPSYKLKPPINGNIK